MSTLNDDLPPAGDPPAGDPPAGNPPAGDPPAGNPPPVPKAWLNDLPEALRSNELISRLDSPAALADEYVKTQNYARGRVALPKDGDEASRTEFIAKARPETADAYEVKLPEGADPATATAFKEKAHELGLFPWQVEALSEFDMGRQSMAMESMTGSAKAELDAMRIEQTPPVYERGTQAVANMLAGLEIEGLDKDKALQGLESAYGAGAAMKLLQGLAAKTGELEKVDATDIQLAIGGMTPEVAKQQQAELMKDAEFMVKAATAGTPEAARWKSLNDAQKPKQS